MREQPIASADRFLESFYPAAEVLKAHIEKGNVIRIITHNDADGVAAGGILSQLLRRMGARFKTTCEKRLDEEMVKAVGAEDPPLVLFADMGGAYLDLLEEHLSGSDVVVLDHHLPVDVEPSNIIHINPLLHDLDGARGISGAGVSYLFAKTIDEGNADLSPLGIVGALADQQDKGEKKSLLGLNKLIEADAKKLGLLDTNFDLIFYGYETRPIGKAFAYTTTPFIPGLSGREDRCLAFLKEAGIELKNEGRWRALRDLSDEEKRSLFSALTKHMVYEGCEAEAVHDLVGTIYTLKGEEAWTPMRDGREYASLLNACARMGRPSLGLCICMGDRNEALKEAEGTLDDYRRNIGKYLDWVREGDRIQEREHIYTLNADVDIDERIIGVVASILLSTGILKSFKPIVASANADGDLIKISARASEEMADKGLDLGDVMMKASEQCEGRGGGHDIAAGAFLPGGRREDFLGLVDRIVGEQVKA
ncbi:MAG: DHH family phosphoesterase [Candidatus Bathyarchaeota archaeon]|nr:MAG: DHH family phosphoesterase [Candidatus Bathyarchaeota archaeon]